MSKKVRVRFLTPAIETKAELETLIKEAAREAGANGQGVVEVKKFNYDHGSARITVAGVDVDTFVLGLKRKKVLLNVSIC